MFTLYKIYINQLSNKKYCYFLIMKLTEFYFHFNNFVFSKNNQIIRIALDQISDNQTNKKYSINEIIYLLNSIGYDNIKKFLIKNEVNQKFSIDISNIFSE